MQDISSKSLTIPDSYDITQSILNKGRSDKYIMVLTLPDALRKLKSEERSNTKIDFDTLQFTIKGTPVPDIIVPAVSQEYAGQALKISSHSRQTYENIFVDFKVDNLFRNWWVIYYWLNLLNDEKNSFYNYSDDAEREPHEALRDYSAKFTVFGLDEYNNRVIRFDYEGAFPVSITSPKYNDESPEEIRSRFEFGFTFFTATLI